MPKLNTIKSILSRGRGDVNIIIAGRNIDKETSTQKDCSLTKQTREWFVLFEGGKILISGGSNSSSETVIH